MPSLCLFVAAVLAVAAAARPLAPPVAARNDPHEADFRTFGVAGCHDANQGVYTLERSQAGPCRPFAAPVSSLLVVDDACTLSLFRDANCTQTPVVAPVGVCQNGDWQSYRLAC